jgi:hypothetical protein
MPFNLFNANSGKKLTNFQRFIYNMVNYWMPMFTVIIAVSLLNLFVCYLLIKIIMFLIPIQGPLW